MYSTQSMQLYRTQLVLWDHVRIYAIIFLMQTLQPNEEQDLDQ